jgi:hypothetical protein
MSLMALMAASQNGLLIRAVGSVVGVDEPVARDALERLLGAIAERLGARAADPVEHDILLDVIASGSFQRYLDDPRALFGREAVRDGEGLLAYALWLRRGRPRARRKRHRAARRARPRGVRQADDAGRKPSAGAMARRLEEQARDPLRLPGPAGALKELGQTVLRGLADGTMRTFRRASFRRRMALRRLNLQRRGGPRRVDRGTPGDLLDREAPS